MKILTSILAIFLILISCDEIKKSNEVSEGTLTAFIECVDSLENEYVKKETIKDFCINKHEKPIRNDLLKNDARAVSEWSDTLRVTGWFEEDVYSERLVFRGSRYNMSENFIITNYAIQVKYYDKYGLDCFVDGQFVERGGLVVSPNRSKPECQNEQFYIYYDDLWLEPSNAEESEYKVVDYDLNPSLQGVDASMFELVEVYGIEIQ